MRPHFQHILGILTCAVGVASQGLTFAHSEGGVPLTAALGSAQHGGQIAVRELRTLDTLTFWAPNQVPLQGIQAH